jgi:peptidoglycan/xylan/chitin deacetylase (PgdA/CDA1 family)
LEWGIDVKFRRKLIEGIIVIGISLGLIASAFSITASPKTEDNAIKLPIIMYHHIIKDTAYSNAFIITSNEFESDLKIIELMGFNTVNFGDIINYEYNNIPLPPNPIIITFDDAYESNYVYAYPMLRKYNMKAVISVVGAFIDKKSEDIVKDIRYSYLTWNQVKEMSGSGVIEIDNHTYNMHNKRSFAKNIRSGVMKMNNEDIDKYTKAIQMDIGELQDRICFYTGKTPQVFTYPFGSHSKTSERIIRGMGFKVTLSAASGINRLTGNPNELYLMKRYIRPHGINSIRFFKNLQDKCK